MIYPSPGYPIYESFTRYVGAQPVPVHLTEESGFTLSGAEIAAAITPRTRMIFLNFPSNPTGRGRLEGAAWGHRGGHPAKVLPRRARLFGRGLRAHPLRRVSPPEHHLRSPAWRRSRSWSAARRKASPGRAAGIGWALFPTVEEAETFKNLNINYFSCVSPYNQEGARLGLESPLARGGQPGDGEGVPGAPGPDCARASSDSRRPLPECRRAPSTCFPT